MERTEDRRKKVFQNAFGMVAIGVVLCVIALILAAVQKGVIYRGSGSKAAALLTNEQVDKAWTQEEIDAKQIADTCLLIYEKGSESGEAGLSFFSEVLEQMKVPFTAVEMEDVNFNTLDRYETIVLSVVDFVSFGDNLGALKRWVGAGGGLMLLFPPSVDSGLQSFYEVHGIEEAGYEYVTVSSFQQSSHFMLDIGKPITFSDPYEASLSLSLRETAEVFLESVDEYPVPLVWRHHYGDGRVVMVNIGYMDKALRGYYAAAYSLVDDSCVYPVINGASFILDDFPAPVPSGEAKYIQRDYNLSVKDFYTQVWWNDIYNLAMEHGMVYTGVIIEDYNDNTAAPFTRTLDTERFTYFGNLIKRMGGELGFHGYNHQPLVPKNFDYRGIYNGYKTWPTTEDMTAAIRELYEFSTELFPDDTFRVYVPPSNVLSDEGRELLPKLLPDLRAIGAVYIAGEDDLGFEQEFEISDDYIVNIPRIFSGLVFGDYMEMALMSELNFHYVSTHFTHPDDALDEDRGAAEGWAKLFDNLSDFVGRIYIGAPDIRNLTGSELAAAVQRYDLVELLSVEDSGSQIDVQLGNFFDEAWFFLRVNENRVPTSAQNAEYTEIADDLYLIQAKAANFTINVEPKEAEE